MGFSRRGGERKVKKIFKKIVAALGVFAMLLGMSGPLLLAKPVNVSASTTWNVGDVFAAVGGGLYKVYDNNGVFKETINNGLGGTFTTGCAFNTTLDKLYTTDFSQTKVAVFDDASPHAVSAVVDTALQSPGGHSESVVFAANGDYYVGHPDGNDDILKYDSTNTFLAAFDVPVESRGSDWVDLASDQQTMFYTSEGRRVLRYDVAANAPLADFGPGLPGAGIAFALRLLPPGDGSGGLLVADNVNVKQLDGAGNVVSTYDVTGVDGWFALNLDPDGVHFWAGSFNNGTFYKFLIQAVPGNYVDTQVTTVNTGSNAFFGLCLKGEPTAAQAQITLDPPSAVNAAGTNHTVTATVMQGGNPVPNTLISFSVTVGPNVGQVSDPGECSVDPNCMTDAAGQTSWTYTSNGVVGTDTIKACFTDEQGNQHCAEATKEWVDKTPPRVACVETVNPHGKTVPPAGKTTLPGAQGGQNEDGFYELLAKDNLPGLVHIFVTDATGAGPFGAFLSGDKVKITEAPGAVPSSKPMGSSNGQAGAIVAHITLNSDALVFAVDAAGNQSAPITCFVPPPPK